jgi:hypothetical protein
MKIGYIDFVILQYVHVQVRCAMESFGNVHQPAITEFQKRNLYEFYAQEKPAVVTMQI